MPYGKPLEHLREVVEIIRLVNAQAHTGELKRFEGKYHKHDFSELQPPAPPVRTDIPIWIAALRGPLISLAAEIGDGVIGHPIWSIDWLTNPDTALTGHRTEARRQGAYRHRVQRVALRRGEQRSRAGDRATRRPTVAFYGGIAQYEEYFAAHGFREEAQQLQRGVVQRRLPGGRETCARRHGGDVCRLRDAGRGAEEDRAGVGGRGLADAGAAGVRPRAGQADGVRGRNREHVLRLSRVLRWQRDGAAVPGTRTEIDCCRSLDERSLRKQPSVRSNSLTTAARSTSTSCRR